MFHTTVHFMKRLYCSLILAVVVSGSAFAQTGVGTTTPHASAQLEVASPNKGVLLPRVSAEDLPAGPAESLLLYQKDAEKGFYYYTGTKWVRLATADDIPVVPTPGSNAGYAGNSTGANIVVVLGGTAVPFPSDQNLGSGITVNGSNTVFTVATAGRYRITYRAATTIGLLMSSRVMINGTQANQSVNSPLVSTSQFIGDFITNLSAGSTISVEFYGLLGVATLAGSSSLVIQKVD